MNLIKNFSTEVYFVLAMILLVLSVYLGFLLRELSRQKKKMQYFREELQKKTEKRNLALFESLRIISLAVVQGQCEISEGCLRIKKLMELIEGLEPKKEYEVFSEVYEEIRGFAYLEARDALSNQERFEQDTKRYQIEQKYQDRVQAGATALYEALKTYNPGELLG